MLIILARTRAAEKQTQLYGEIEAVKDSSSGHLEALNVMRLVAILHLTFLHVGPEATKAFNFWGGSWLSFYFALSGFGPAYSKLKKPQVDTPRADPEQLSMCIWVREHASSLAGVFQKRWLSVFPLYCFAVLVAATAALYYDGHVTFWVIGMELAMLQSYGPHNYFIQLCYNIPDWFVSALVACWLLEDLLFELAKACWRRGPCCVVLAWAGAFAWKAGTQFIIDHFGLPFGSDNGMPDLHCYFCGILLGFAISGQSRDLKWVSRVAATVATLLLIVTFTFVQDSNFHNSISRTGLCPLQCLLMYGLAMGEDPLAKLFATMPPFAHKLSYGIYILSMPLKLACPWWRKTPIENLLQMSLFLLLLALFAAFSNEFVHKPCERLLKACFARCSECSALKSNRTGPPPTREISRRNVWT